MWLMPAQSVVDLVLGHVHVAGDQVQGGLHAVAQADERDVGRAQRPADHGHRVDIVQQQRVRAELLHVVAMSSTTGMLRRARKMPPGPSVSPMHWSTPYFSGIL